MNAGANFLQTAAAPDPLATALRYATAPYGRGIGALALKLTPAVSGTSNVLPYDFSTYETQYGLEPQNIVASYVLTLGADELASAATVDIVYIGGAGAGTVRVLIPAGTLAGVSFALAPLPNDPALVLQSLTERPVPAAGEPSGPDKWGLTALIGNGSRLMSALTAELQVLAATARDVRAQRRLVTARAASLDRIGDSLGVPRLLPAPYRLNADSTTVALYHLDDPIAPVIDATQDFPGVNVGAGRGAPGRFNGACRITSAGGMVIPDAAAFAVDPASGFTVEMFANLAAPPAAGQWAVFAVKRPRFDPTASSAKQAASPGWSLALEPSAGGHDLALTLTDQTGVVVRAAAPNLAPPAGWFHVAGVVNPATGEAAVYLNGQPVGTASLSALGVVSTGANIGLGSDLNGAPLLNGSLDEARLSNVARTDFSSVLGANAQAYAVDDQTIALYHLDETDDWIDEDRSAHYAINSGAERGVAARFDNGLRFSGDLLPNSHCRAESDFQMKLSAGSWDRGAGAQLVQAGPYARFGYRQGAISEPGLDGALHPVFVNDQAAPNASTRGFVTTACYGFTPDDPTNSNDPSQTIARFQAAGRSVQEAIDYFGEWRGLPLSFFANEYQTHGVTAAYEPCLPPSSTRTSVMIPGSTDFAFDAATSFTIEAFIKPDPVSDDYARAVVSSRSSGLLPGGANADEAGWALCLGSYHSIPNNLRWILGDGRGALVTLDADMNLADGAFHHIAGVVDRDLGAALLYVDGILVREAALGNMGLTATSGPILLGNSPALAAPYAGVLDEVRISRTALSLFQPVLGESDLRYRQRLAIFRPWRLPVYPTVRRVAQALTLSEPDEADVVGLLLGDDPLPENLIQLDVDETDSTRFCASQWFRLIPEALTPGQAIAVDGTTPATEPSVTGLAPLASNSPALLTEPDGVNYSFATPASRQMILATAQALERFAARLAVVAPGATISVLSAYAVPTAPAAPTSNDNLGRALTMVLSEAPTGFDLGVLGALAFATGFAFVAYETAPAPLLRLIVAPGDDLELAVTSQNAPGFDPFNRQIAIVNQPMTISIVRPALSLSSGLTPALEWSVLPFGPAAAALTPAAAGAVTFTGTALGSAVVTVRYTLGDGVTVLVGSLAIVIAPETLDGCDMVGGDGTANVTETSASGLPDPDFRTDYLISSTCPLVDYAGPAAKRMQLPLEAALIRLVRLALSEPGAPRITVLAAYDPNAANLQIVGRGASLAPSSANLTAQRLGALAFLAGFSYVERRRYPQSVYVSVPQGNRFEIFSGPIKRLWPGARISGRGEIMATEFAAAGPPDSNFVPSMLQTFTDARASFAGVSNQVQPSLAIALSALLDALTADNVAGVLQVIAGFTTQDPTLLGVGRAVVARHPSVGPDRLCGYALEAGFGFVEYRAWQPGGAAVYMAAYPVTGAPPNLKSSSSAAPLVAHTTIGTASAADVQTLSLNGSPTDGWFTLAFKGQPAAARYNAGAAEVQAALTALAAIGANNVVCTGGPLPAAAVTITFAGALAIGPQPLISVVATSLVGPPDPNANYVNLFFNPVTQNLAYALAIQPQLAVEGQIEWALQSACPAAALLSTALPDPSDKPGVHQEIIQGTSAGAVAAVATFSLRDFSDPYQFRILPYGALTTSPRLTKDQYDDLMNFLDAYHPLGVEGVTVGLRAFVHGFARPPRWDRLPTSKTYPRYRINR